MAGMTGSAALCAWRHRELVPETLAWLYLPLLSASTPRRVISALFIRGFSLKGMFWSLGTWACHSRMRGEQHALCDPMGVHPRRGMLTQPSPAPG